MVVTTYKTTEDMIINSHELKGKTKLKFYKSSSNYYDNMIILFDEDPFAEDAQGISKIYCEVLLLMKFLPTKPQIKNTNSNYYDLYYTVIKDRGDREIVVDNENNYIDFNDYITPNHYIGRKK